MKVWHKCLLVSQFIIPTSVALWTGAHYAAPRSGLEFILGFLGTVTMFASLGCAGFSIVEFLDDRGV